MIEAEERKLARIPHDLADDIGQGMASLPIYIEPLRTSLPHLPAITLTMSPEPSEQISDLSRDIQTAAHTLHSRKLKPLGLPNIAASFLKEFGQQHDLETDFTSKHLPQISVCLFRVLDKTLSNSLAHNGARQLEVRRFEESHPVHLVVGNAGVGFNPDAATERTGLGHISIEERIKLVKGTISFDSQPKRGTTIHAMVALSRGTGIVRAAGQPAPRELIPV